MGLAASSTLPADAESGEGWQNAEYSVTRAGYEALEVIRSSIDIEPLWDFLMDLSAAYVLLDNDTRENSTLKDLTYDQPGKSRGSIIRFEEVQSNLSSATAASFQELDPGIGKIGRQDELRMYLQYLELRELAS